MPSALLRAALAAVAAALACVGATSAAAALPLSSGGGAGLSLSPPSLAAGGGADPSAPSSSFCGVVMNDSTRVFSFASVDNATGAVTDLLALPMLDEFGLGVSAGARGGVYYTISANASEQAEVLVADVARGAAGFVAVRLPPEFAFLSLFGVAMLDVDDADGGYALAMVMGYAPDGRRYCFLGLMEGATGAIARPLYNLTEAYRTWVYLYSGISAWDARRGLYYLEAVTGERDTTSEWILCVRGEECEGGRGGVWGGGGRVS